jgi:ribosomal protein S18 acetylase RimI-like enzyme
MIQDNYRIQSISTDNREEINKIIQNQWFSTDMVIRGEVVDMTKLDGYAVYEGEQIIGLITYRMTEQDCEITSFDSFRENQGIGTEMLHKVIETAKSKNCRKMKLITTNDNINAIRYYQKRGFDMTNLYYNAIEQSRIIKPSIPLLGDFNIPIRHEIEFQMQL